MYRYYDGFIADHARTTDSRTPVAYFHSWDGDTLQLQGDIYHLDPDGSGFAQLFDWMSGAASNTTGFTKRFLLDCTYYSTESEWLTAASYHDRRHRSVLGSSPADECPI